MEETEGKDPEKSDSMSETQDVEMKEDEEDKVDIKTDGEQNDDKNGNDNDGTKDDADDEKHDDDDADDEAKDDNENSLYLRISDPAVLSCHHDGYLRFWNLEVCLYVLRNTQ